MDFCEFLSESPLGNVGLGVRQSSYAALRGFHVYKGPSPLSWASFFTERLVLYLVHTVQFSRSLTLDPCFLNLSLSLNSDVI